MPRPVPPILLGSITIDAADKAAARLDERARKEIAEKLGVETLGDLVTDAIEHSIACYRKTKGRSGDTTTGSTLAALDVLQRAISRAQAAIAKTPINPKKIARACRELRHFLDPGYGVGYEVQLIVDPYARPLLLDLEWLAAGGRTSSELIRAPLRCIASFERAVHGIALARQRMKEIGRVSPDVEPFRQFCGVIGFLFSRLAEPKLVEREGFTRARREFALAVLDAAGIERADYDAHPERLDEILSTDVSLA